MTAICIVCGKQQHPQTMVDEGGELILGNHTRAIANARCWRCKREQLAAGLSLHLRSGEGGEGA